MDILSRMCGINNTWAGKPERSGIVYNYEDDRDLPEHVALKDYMEIKKL
jgi:hypothetical protein